MERPRSWWIRRGVVVSLLALMCLGAAPNEEKPLVIGPRAAEITVVDNWDALMKTTPVIVDGVELRLGIESKECAEGAGILVYCIPGKGYEKLYRSDGEIRMLGEELGPFHVRVISKVDHEVQKLVDRQNLLAGKEPVMFVVAARPRGNQPFEVQVATRDGIIVATRKIEVGKAIRAGWRQLEETAAVDRGLPRCASGNPVVPHFDGSVPTVEVKNLPHFLPEEPDHSLAVSMEKGVVHVKSSRYVEESLTDNWAVRWWVNGRLVANDDVEKLKQMRKDRQVRERKLPIELSFRLELDAEALKTKPGDVVEFQLMYSSSGFDFDSGRMMLMKRAIRVGEVGGAWISKRVPYAP